MSATGPTTIAIIESRSRASVKLSVPAGRQGLIANSRHLARIRHQTPAIDKPKKMSPGYRVVSETFAQFC